MVSLLFREVLTARLEDGFNLFKANTGKNCKGEEEGEENAEGTNEEPTSPVGWNSPSLMGRNRVDGRYDDYVAFEPHTDVYDNRQDEGRDEAGVFLIQNNWG